MLMENSAFASMAIFYSIGNKISRKENNLINEHMQGWDTDLFCRKINLTQKV